MARKRASMREGPLAELFRATEAAQRQSEDRPRQAPPDADEVVEEAQEPAGPEPEPEPELPPAAVAPPPPAPTAPPVDEPPPVQRAPSPAHAPAEERPAARWIEPLPEQPPRLYRAPRADSAAYLAVIRIVGVGGAGLNAIDRMIDSGITGVEFVAVNTDIQQLQMSDAPIKIHIGRELTEGLGSGADPEIGRQAAG